jgi:trans-aconitate methyltransferase
VSAALAYTPLERLRMRRPVARLSFLAEACRGRRVLDLGGWDETAAAKRDSTDWLHGRLAETAASVIGVDSAENLPAEGLQTGPRSRMIRGDVYRLDALIDPADIDIVVAGELVEHLPDTAALFRSLRALFAGRRLLVTTPNATALTNVLLGLAGRENNHPDHTQLYSFKTLHTLCLRTGFAEWEVLPYHQRYSEMMLRSGPLARWGVRAAEAAVNLGETAFPFLAGGLILDVRRV